MILTGATLFIAVAALYGAVTLAGVIRLGQSWHQALLYSPLKLAYRIGDRQIRQARAAPAPVIYVVTHQSRLDPALMLSVLPEDTLHILDAYSANAGWLEPFRGLARTIIFNPEHVFVSRRLVRVLKGNGRLAVYIPDAVEPETRALRLFRAVSRIAMQADAKIVPIFIDGARMLPMSFTPEKQAPRRLLPRLRITALSPMTIPELIARSGSPSVSASNALFDRVAEARVEASTGYRTVFEAARRAADRLGGNSTIVEDVVSGAMSYRKLLIAARIFGGRFARMTAPDETVGLMLPNSNGIAVALLGLMSAARPAAILNYTSGPANVTSAIGTALIRTVISSRAFVEKAGFGDLVRTIEAAGAKIVWLEDLRTSITIFDKVAAAVFWRRAVAKQVQQRPAVVMFTSGSEGTPKAVVLSHRNLVTNAMQVEARLVISPEDRLLNILPLFHCFGLTGGLFLPVLTGVRVFLYPSPLHYRAIPGIARKFGATILVGTDTFLAAYANTADDADFATVRMAVAGAEAVRADTRRVWNERFGVRVLEGYGMTEASPVVAVNTATHGRDGTVGRMSPGMQMRLEPVEGVADGGRLWVAGPNVMMGIMNADRPGVLQPLANGWHDSGDIVSVDREGFVSIRGRAKRFAKIAGEMVSLGAVELLAGGMWPEHRHAAVSVPDERRGERIVLVTTADNAEAAALRSHGKQAGATDLMIPSDIIKVDELPILALGKTDYVAVRRLALERLGLAEAA